MNGLDFGGMMGYVNGSFINNPKNAAKVREHIGKYIKLPPEVLARQVDDGQAVRELGRMVALQPHEFPTRFVLASVLIGSAAAAASAQSNIDPVNKFAWQENCGWLNWHDANAGSQGVVIGTKFLAGYAWGENIGWINLDDAARFVGFAPACYPDCDGDTVLTIDDFICFQTFFALGDPYADCDADSLLTIDDFICFQTLFALADPSTDCDESGTLAIDDFICFQTLFAIGC